MPATLVFDYPTPAAVARYLLDEVLEPGRASASLSAPAPSASAASTEGEEAIAIVGVGCRFPGGVTDLESFWRLLDGGVDAVREVPPERWDIDAWYDADPDAPGKMCSRWGGFLPDIERFDPGFFGISADEALSVDPQQRLLLETSWEALEHAGIPPARLMGTNTGVYIGLCGTEYNARLLANHHALGPYTLLGSMHSTMVGRLSYWLGLRGPNLPVDTACSSSLVAVHLACQALRQREVSLALAGGANVLLDPAASVCFSQLRATSPSGRCRSFSADADGYVRAEGAGVVVLERLSDALTLGHRVLSVIRSSAVNQDGRSNGPTAPNGLSQQAVIRDALRRAALPPDAIGYVECHGTGTPLGDPIEVQALGAVLARPHTRRRPLVIGSLKTNLGHMEGAAGIGGLIKAALVVDRARIPSSLHFSAPSPHIPWNDLDLHVAAQPLDWPDDGSPRIAGVSSFGISGTNAHIIVEQPPALSLPPAPHRSAELCVLSAKTPLALRDAARRLQRHLLAHPHLSLRDVAFSLSLRAPLEQRLALPVRSIQHLVESLDRLDSTPDRQPDDAGSRAPIGEIGFVLSEVVSPGAGRELLSEEPTFREAFQIADRAITAETGQSLLEALSGPDAAAPIRDALARPLAFAVQLALAALLRSWGIEPAFAVGHDLGAITAACVSGDLSIDAGAKLVCARDDAPLDRRAASARLDRATRPAAAAAGAVWLELGAADLTSPDLESWRATGAEAPLVLRCLERGQPERLTLLTRLGALVERGLTPTPASFPDSGRRLDLPTYPWQRQRYWLEPEPRRPSTPVDELAALLQRITERSSLSESTRLGVAEILAALTASSRDTVGEAPSDPSAVARARREADASRLRRASSPRDVLRWLTERCAELLGQGDPDDLDVRRGFFDLGLDSLKLTELHRVIQSAWGESLPQSTLFTHPNLSALADLLWLERHGARDEAGEPTRRRAPPAAEQAPPSNGARPHPPELGTEATLEDLARYLDRFADSLE